MASCPSRRGSSVQRARKVPELPGPVGQHRWQRLGATTSGCGYPITSHIAEGTARRAKYRLTLCERHSATAMRSSPPIWPTGCPGLIEASVVPELDVLRACEAAEPVNDLAERCCHGAAVAQKAVWGF